MDRFNEIFVVLAVASLPVFLLLIYFWYRDKGEPEPMQLMRRIFILGFLGILPAVFIELLIQYSFIGIFHDLPWWYWFIAPFFFVALPEEYVKLWMVKKVAYNHPKFNELMDGINYCVLASMGFAMFENINYTLQYGLSTGMLRAFTAVPAHALFSGFMGFYLGYARFAQDEKQEKRMFKKALFVGVLFHGLYDFLLMSAIPYLMLMVFPLLFYMASQLHQGIRLVNAQRKQEELEYL